jgi:hypothetical protein
MRFCVSINKKSIGYTDKATVYATLKNIGSSAYTWSGSSSCGNKADLLINGRDTGLSDICTEDITGFNIAAGESKSQSIDLIGSDLQAGKNTVQVGWAELTSPTLNVTGNSPNSLDKQKESSCLRDQDSSYCSTISVIIKGSDYNDSSTCSSLETYFSSLNIKPESQYCDLASSGILFYLVPKSDAQQWVNKFSAITQVDQANITN